MTVGFSATNLAATVAEVMVIARSRHVRHAWKPDGGTYDLTCAWDVFEFVLDKAKANYARALADAAGDCAAVRMGSLGPFYYSIQLSVVSPSQLQSVVFCRDDGQPVHCLEFWQPLGVSMSNRADWNESLRQLEVPEHGAATC
jgi:hypothetical protein